MGEARGSNLRDQRFPWSHTMPHVAHTGAVLLHCSLPPMWIVCLGTLYNFTALLVTLPVGAVVGDTSSMSNFFRSCMLLYVCLQLCACIATHSLQVWGLAQDLLLRCMCSADCQDAIVLELSRTCRELAQLKANLGCCVVEGTSESLGGVAVAGSSNGSPTTQVCVCGGGDGSFEVWLNGDPLHG